MASDEKMSNNIEIHRGNQNEYCMWYLGNNKAPTRSVSCNLIVRVATMNRYALVVGLLIVIGCSGADEQPMEARDSYMDAYHESHTNVDQPAVNPNDRESKYSPYYEGGASGPGQEYGPPSHGYPETPYPPPGAHYGAPMYGPPSHGPSFPPPFLGMPHAMLGLLDKFHLKLDIFTVLKIILKLVIFKKIVSFIAVLCLLLFIPKFKMSKGGDNDDDDAEDARSIFDSKSAVDARINTLTQYVLGAIDKYSQNTNSTACDSTNCDVNRMLHEIGNKYSYDRLMTMYIQEQS